MNTSAVSSKIIVIGASAGGLEAISEIIGGLPEGFPVPILYVSHMPMDRRSALPEILPGRTALEVESVTDGAILRPGRLYTSVAGHNVTVEHGVLRLAPSDGESKFCPSINMAISSAARAYGENSIAILLTGMLDDGVDGLQENHRCGGFTIVQNPHDAKFPSMPLEALARDHPDSVLPISAIAERLVTLTYSEDNTPKRAEEDRIHKILG